MKNSEKEKTNAKVIKKNSAPIKKKSNQLLNIILIIIALIQIVLLCQFINNKSDIDLYEDCGWEPDISKNISSSDNDMQSDIDNHSTSGTITGNID